MALGTNLEDVVARAGHRREALGAGRNVQRASTHLHLERAPHAVGGLPRERVADGNHGLEKLAAQRERELETSHVPAQPLVRPELAHDLTVLARDHQPVLEQIADDGLQAVRRVLRRQRVSRNARRRKLQLRFDRVLHGAREPHAEDRGIGDGGNEPMLLVQQVHERREPEQRLEIFLGIDRALRLWRGARRQLPARRIGHGCQHRHGAL